MKTIQGFTPFTTIEKIAFARAGIWKQTAFDRVKQPKPFRGINLEPCTVLVERFHPKYEFPSLVTYVDFLGAKHILELDSVSRSESMRRDIREKILAILN